MAKGTIWITGGGSGIGRALAHSFAKDGYRVAVSGRRGEALVETATADRSVIHPFPLDVTDPEAVDLAIDAIEQTLAPIEIAILDAGIYRPLWVADFDRTIFREMVETNLLGVVNALEPLLRRMRLRGGGTIVIVASVAGYGGLPGAAAYGATKAALTNMAEALHPDARRYGIHIAVANPGFVRTPLTEGNSFAMPFLIDAEEASCRIRTGIAKGKFEIAFPRRFAMLLKLLRLLPYRGYFAITRRMLPQTPDPGDRSG
jgi:NAD(P)-dependent dehydrogenase (short-subunit alcohol dehydrogenase family)